jgi:DNA repair protein RecO
MYKQITTPAIILSRTNFNEVDRIVNFLGPKGQFSCMVKGARKPKSKLAGGIELFSVSQITYLDTNAELKRIVQTKLLEHYGGIAKNLERMLFGYECMRQLKRIVPEMADEDGGDEYYLSLKILLESLERENVGLNLIKLWWQTKTLEFAGQNLELHKDAELKKLFEGQNYSFMMGTARLTPKDGGVINSTAIKILRLMAEGRKPAELAKLKGVEQLSATLYKELEAAVRE